MSRWPLLAGVALIVLGATGAGAGTSATPSLKYYRLAVGADFNYELDYGAHPDATLNGKYSRQMAYTINAIAVYNGRTVWVPRGLMLVQGFEYIDQRMTQWALPNRVRIRCRGDDFFETKGAKAVVSPGAIGVSDTGMSIDPGPAVRWNVDCSATEQLETHGLIGGPQFVVPPPSKARFSGTQAFSIGCRDSYSHPFRGEVDGHSFEGSVRMFVRFTPFAASRLEATKKRLRDSVGENLPDGFTQLSSRPLKVCP